METKLQSAYRWNRRHYVGNVYPRRKDYIRHNPAHEALEAARRDVANGTPRYPSAQGWNPRFEAFGERHMRWIENPAACGLRFVGYADELCRSIRHTGWFLDNDQSETVRGVVFQLPGRNGKPQFIAGYADPWNDGPVCLSFDVAEGEGTTWETVPGAGPEPYGYWAWEENPRDNDGARTAARWADGIAERMAEESREHDSAWHAGQRFAELGEEIAQARHEIRAAIQKFKRVRRLIGETGEFTRLCQIIRSDVTDDLEKIREARAERARLKEGDFIDEWLPGFSTRDESLVAAFNEGAGQ